MNNTVEDRVEYWEEQGKEVYSPLASSDVAAIVFTGFNQDGDAAYNVLMPDGETFHVASKECSCGNEIDVEPTSEVTARRRKLGQACEHQKAQMQAVYAGGTCSNCGELAVEQTNHTDSVGNVLVQSYHCAGCGTSRRER